MTPHPLPTQRECPPPAPKAGGGGVHSRRVVRGWESNILEDARHWIGLLQFNLSTGNYHPSLFFFSSLTYAFGLILSAPSCKQMLGKKAQLNLMFFALLLKLNIEQVGLLSVPNVCASSEGHMRMCHILINSFHTFIL